MKHKDFIEGCHMIQKIIKETQHRLRLDRAKWIEAKSKLKHLQELPSMKELLAKKDGGRY